MHRTHPRQNFIGSLHDDWVYGEESSDVHETSQRSRRKEWEMYEGSKTVFRPTEDDNTSLMAQGARTLIKSTELHKLKPGDHIGWRRHVIWHHAIVLDISPTTHKISVIHFAKENWHRKVRIKKEDIDADKEVGELFRFDYSKGIERENPKDSVIKRAHKLEGMANYNLFTNNCEHFARYCKTGKRESTESRWAVRNIKKSLQSGGAHYSLGKVAGAEGIEGLSQATNWVGAGLMFAFEAAHMCYDIYHLRKLQQKGKLSSKDYKVEVTTRVSEGVIGATGGTVCAFIGGVVGSVIPVVGTFIGSVVGGVLGYLGGKFAGTALGRWLGRKLWG